MTNNEKFNALLNNCRRPRAVYNALSALAPTIREVRDTFPERFTGKSDQEVINEIATVVRRAGEVAQLLQLSEDVVYPLIHRADFPAVRIDRRRLEKWAAAQTKGEETA